MSDVEKVILSMYETGLSSTRISDALNLERRRVLSTIKNKFPDYDGRRKKLSWKEIASLYKAGDGICTLAERYDTSPATIRSGLTAAGVELRTSAEQKKVHFFNEDFFHKIDTEDKAYWLGFIFADGNVSSRLMDVSLYQATKYRGHLEKFLASIDYEGPGNVLDLSSEFAGGQVSEYSKVSLRSTRMAKDLVTHGCVPNKSLDGEGPSGLPKAHRAHFLRGLVDGDGYVSAQGPPALEVVGNYQTLSWVKDNYSEFSEVRPHKNIFRVRAASSKALALMEEVYQGANVYLDRKYERAMRNLGR